MSDLYRKMWDYFLFKHKTRTAGETPQTPMNGNIAFACTPGDMNEWRGYEKAMRNGTFARISLFAAGQRFEGERPDVKDNEPIKAWREVQAALHEYRNVAIRPELDRELNEEIEYHKAIASRMTDNGNHTASWLAKSEERVARVAAQMFLIDCVLNGKRDLRGEVAMPRKFRRMAWKFVFEFAWRHQVHIHDALILSEMFKGSLWALFLRIAVHEKQTITRDELTGSKAPKGVKGSEEFIKMLLFGLAWIRPRVTHKSYNRQRPWEAGSFDINPKIRELYTAYGDRLREEHAIALGKVKAAFRAENDEK
jgi:hypothetical protein